MCVVSDALVLSSIVILVALFSIQRFGTGKVGFLFAPVLALWFFSLGAIGIYNLLKYDITVIRALNPYYIVLFFNKNSKQAWSALGGCVLCITGKNTHSHLTTFKKSNLSYKVFETTQEPKQCLQIWDISQFVLYRLGITL